eukprot:1747962-Rhodomonas_salina.1
MKVDTCPWCQCLSSLHRACSPPILPRCIAQVSHLWTLVLPHKSTRVLSSGTSAVQDHKRITESIPARTTVRGFPCQCAQLMGLLLFLSASALVQLEALGPGLQRRLAHEELHWRRGWDRRLERKWYPRLPDQCKLSAGLRRTGRRSPSLSPAWLHRLGIRVKPNWPGSLRLRVNLKTSESRSD